MEESVINSFMQPGHLALFSTIMGLVLGIMSLLWKFYFPKALTASLANGAGKQIGDILEARILKAQAAQHEKFEEALVKSEERQDAKIAAAVALNDEKLKQAFSAHEEVEELKLRLVVQETKSEERACSQRVLDKLQAHDERLTRVESLVAKS